ncbi:unknown [Ruminococcus sp. CAG:382]|nr:unknown [Ruminococcus sp. CAG:382]
MMGRGRDCIRAFGDHTCARNVADNLRTRQMTADTRLCTLSHFDLDRRTGIEIILINAETSRRDLNYRICTVAIKILMQTAFTGVVIDTERL